MAAKLTSMFLQFLSFLNFLSNFCFCLSLMTVLAGIEINRERICLYLYSETSRDSVVAEERRRSLPEVTYVWGPGDGEGTWWQVQMETPRNGDSEQIQHGEEDTDVTHCLKTKWEECRGQQPFSNQDATATPAFPLLARCDHPFFGRRHFAWGVQTHT